MRRAGDGEEEERVRGEGAGVAREAAGGGFGVANARRESLQGGCAAGAEALGAMFAALHVERGDCAGFRRAGKGGRGFHALGVG